MTIFTGKISGDLVIRKGDDASGVTSIGGYLHVYEGATCNLPICASIGGYPIPAPELARARLRAVAEKVVNAPDLLDMGDWHNECRTVHCIAGWAVHLEPGGYELEKKVGSTLLAGNILLGIEASKLFFLENDVALSELRSVLEGSPA